MLNPRLRTSSLAMSYITNADRVRQQVFELIGEKVKKEPFVGEGFKVSGARLEVKDYSSLKDYIRAMGECVEHASAKGSQLIVFPELSGMMPLMLMPKYKAILKDLVGAMKTEDSIDAQKTFYQVCDVTQGFVGEIYLNTMSQLAKSYKISIGGGSLYRIDNKKLYNRQYLFTPNGEVSGMQDKLYLSGFEKTVGVTAGEELIPAATSFGQIALLTTSALQYYEPFAIAAALGCAAATAGTSPFNESDVCAPFRAQESGMAIIVAGVDAKKEMVGFDKNNNVTIYAPMSISKTTGAVMGTESAAPSITCRIDPLKNIQKFDNYSADRNPRFYKELIIRLVKKEL